MQDNRTEQSAVWEVDVLRLLRLLWKKIWVILAVAVVFGIVAGIYSSVFITPTYRTGFSAYISNKELTSESVSTSSSDLSTSRGLMYVYKEIIVSRAVLTQAAVESGFYDLVPSMVTVDGADSTPIMRVYVVTEDPEMSQRLAEAIARIAPEQVAKVVAGSTMTLIDEPYTPRNPYSPNVKRNAVYSALIGALLAVIVLIVIDLVYDKVLEEDDFEARYNLPMIGRIPDLHYAQKSDAKYGQSKERGGRR